MQKWVLLRKSLNARQNDVHHFDPKLYQNNTFYDNFIKCFTPALKFSLRQTISFFSTEWNPQISNNLICGRLQSFFLKHMNFKSDIDLSHHLISSCWGKSSRGPVKKCKSGWKVVIALIMSNLNFLFCRSSNSSEYQNIHWLLASATTQIGIFYLVHSQAFSIYKYFY